MSLLCFLLNLDETTLLASPMLGAIWETFVFAEMRKLNEIGGRPVGLWYYRDLPGREVDFVLESGGKLRFAECKWQEHPGAREARSLSRVNADLEAAEGPWKPGEHYVLGRPAAASALAPGIIVASVDDLPAILAGRSPLEA